MKNEKFAVLAVFLLAPIAAHADYTFALIDYPGSSSTDVFGINDRGAVVGSGLGDLHAQFVYRWRDASFREVPPVSADVTSDPAGINDARVIVGSTRNPDGTQSAYIRQPDGTYTVFNHPDAVFYTNARGINDHGLVTGFHDTADGTYFGFIYNPATGAFLDIVPSLFTIAHGINSSNEVVGSVNVAEPPCPGTQADIYGWLRASNGFVTFFLVNGHATQARGINDAGYIAGTVYGDDGRQRGFITRLNGTTHCESVSIPASRLIEFPGNDATILEGISNGGGVVGITESFADRVDHGFIATPN